jgi:UDP-N-acetylmuramyl pentapeptide phosphotransferase/UDP-N-acetylglucosamine-1-phosphate transferase
MKLKHRLSGWFLTACIFVTAGSLAYSVPPMRGLKYSCQGWYELAHCAAIVILIGVVLSLYPVGLKVTRKAGLNPSPALTAMIVELLVFQQVGVAFLIVAYLFPEHVSYDSAWEILLRYSIYGFAGGLDSYIRIRRRERNSSSNANKGG